MRDGVRKRIWVAALAALAALGFVRGQITGGSGDGSLFLPFSGVLGYVGDGLMGTTSGSDPYGYAELPPPDPVRADCVRLGIPTSLQVNQVGTTTSPFCPGVAGVWANAGGDWTVFLLTYREGMSMVHQGGTAGQQVTTTAQVWSYRTTTVTVYYTYNPPQEPPNQNELRIMTDFRTGETTIYYNGVAYRPGEVSGDQMQNWISSTDGFIHWTTYDQDGTQRDWITRNGVCVGGDCP